MSKFTVYLLALIKLTVLVCVGILCVGMLYGLLYLTTPRVPLSIALHTIGLHDLAQFVHNPKLNPPQEDFRQVETSDITIALWVEHCLELKQRTTPTMGAERPPPRHEELALMRLSGILTVQRLALHSRVQSAYFVWQCTSLFTITVGMITTILVSVSSTEFGRGDGWNQRLIRILAIIFPALGTATAATIAFYSPQAEWSQASRTLASVTQLHDQIALGVWKLTCLRVDNTEEARQVTTTLDDWSKRYHDIQTVSSVTGGATSTRGEGGGGGRQGSGDNNQGGAPVQKPPP